MHTGRGHVTPDFPDSMESTVHTYFSTRPWHAVAGVVAAALLVAANPLTYLPADAAPAATKRIAGDTRLATAARVAEEAFPGGTDWAVITGADDWHATLGSAALAGQLNAAQLLAWPDRLDETAKSLDRLGVKRIIIVGSISEVSGAVERQLREKFIVERLAPTSLGDDSYYELARQLTARTIMAAGGQAVNTPGVIPTTDNPTGAATPSPSASSSPSATPTPSPSARAASDSAVLPSTGKAQEDNTEDGNGAANPTQGGQGSGGASTDASTEPEPVTTSESSPAEDQSAFLNRPSTPVWNVPNTFAKVNGKRTVFIASGNAFPDALAASPLSYRDHIPVLFADAPGKGVPEHTLLAIEAYQPEQIVVLGGTSAISQDTVTALSKAGKATQIVRLAGAERVATSVEVAQWTIRQAGFDPHTLSIARGDAFPDAMTSAQFAAHHRSPIVLSTAPKYLTQVPVQFALKQCRAIDRVVGFGGNSALDETVLKAMASAAGCTRPSSLPQVVPNPSTPKPKPTATTTPAPTPSPRPTGSPSPRPSNPPSGSADP
ncbi:cell wall-binding repeat-containing protein, partial [Stomatohabitans albus]